MFGTPVSLRIDERRAPGSMVDVATQQVGGMQCVWGGQTRTDNGYDDTIELTVLPAGASDYANFGPPTVSTNGAAIDTAGDHSGSSCQSSGDTFSCSAQLLVGQYWVTIIYTNSDGAGPPRAAASALLQTSLQQLATSIRAAGSPRPPFVPSSSAWSGAALCGAGSEANVQAAFGSPLTQSQASYPPYGITSVAASRASGTQCAWATQKGGSGATQVDVAIVPGGGWALPAELTDPPSDYYFGAKKSVRIAGATGAMIACNSVDCEAFLSVDSNWLSIAVSSPGDATTVSGQIAALLAVTPRS